MTTRALKRFAANRLATALLLSVSMVSVAAVQARADEYTDLLDILRAKGSLSQGEYSALMKKHRHTGRHGMGIAPVDTTAEDQAAAEARQNAISAAASAAAAQAAIAKMQVMEQQMTSAPDIVHMEPYKPGGGATLKVGDVSLNFSGIVNAYYTESFSGKNQAGAIGGLTDTSGFDNAAIRNGLLPGAFIFTASTTQDGIDMSAVFGVFPGINTSAAGSLGANSGGNPVGIGTAGGDFRKMYFSVGTKEFGTFKLGRDIGIFGADAILNDATLLAVGATGSNAAPGNTSLGRIGYGYIYTDFLPQISYASPIWNGLQATVGVFQPLNATGFGAGSVSDTTSHHTTPLFEGKLTYDYKADMFTAHAWAGFLVQPQQGIPTAVATVYSDKTAAAGEGGVALTFGPVGLTGYYYHGTGVGTTGIFYDGIAYNGELRDSEGGYIQGSIKVTPKLKLVASYGESSLYLAPGEFDPNLVRRNESEVGAVQYGLTPWVTLIGEFTHEESHAHGPFSSRGDAISAGGILLY